jgi:hypothetical protein
MELFARLSRNSTTSTEKSTSRSFGTEKQYRGAEVVANPSECCQAAKAIAGQRFLPEETPMLPLASCEVTDCRCTYKRFDERRTELRRAADVGYDMATQLHDQESRESASPGRRSADYSLLPRD